MQHIRDERLTCRRFPTGILNWDGKLNLEQDHYQLDMDDQEKNKKNLQSLLNDKDFLNAGNRQARRKEVNDQKKTQKKIESESATPKSLVDALEEDVVTFLYDEEENKSKKCVI